jgi:hypothetical protein
MLEIPEDAIPFLQELERRGIVANTKRYMHLAKTM